MLISYVLPAYKSKYLKGAIISILGQSYSNLELIIVDDNSPEDLYSIVSQFDDLRISYYKNSHNIGRNDLVAQWNKSIGYAKGDYLVLASDDDVYHENFNSECIKLINKYPEVDLIRSRVSVINDTGKLIDIDGILPERCSQIELVYSWLKGKTFVCIGNYLFKARTIQRQLFDNLPSAFGTDIISTIKLAENGVANTNEMLFSFRVSNIHHF